MIGDWLIVAFVFAVLWLFWFWLGQVFDAITEWHAAAREASREDAQAREGKGSS